VWKSRLHRGATAISEKGARQAGPLPSKQETAGWSNLAMPRASLTDLPFWPRLLSREEAARYVGVSSAVFDDEVKHGIWPPALRRGGKGGRLTWDRNALDKAADRASGLEEVAGPAATGPAHSEEDAAFWLEKINATSSRNGVARQARRTR
jgi:hypothetical protein